MPRFTAVFVTALGLGVSAAVVIAPIAAVVVAAAGWRFPFPRIFDRTVMVTLAIALCAFAPRLELVPLIGRGFSKASRSLGEGLWGLLLALAIMAGLFALAALTAGSDLRRTAEIAVLGLRYIPAAIAIALIEETFFRAILLGGMADDFGRRAALIVTAVIFAVTHLIRSPAHFYVTAYEPAAGWHDLVASVARLADFGHALPTLFGLFMLGLVLGEAFLVTGRVYASIGMHCGFVLGAKTWHLAALRPRLVPRWLAGGGPTPLIAAPAAWILAAALMTLLPAVFRFDAEPRTARAVQTS